MDWDELDESDDAGFDPADEDEDATVPCSSCGAEIYDDAERCPECGHYQSREDAPRSQWPLWIIVGIGVCLLIAIAWGLLGA